jgi:hypothetical protein
VRANEADGELAAVISGTPPPGSTSIVAPVVAVLALLLSVVTLAALADERAGRPWDLTLAAGVEPSPAEPAVREVAPALFPLGAPGRLSAAWSVRVLGAERVPPDVGSANARGVVVTIALTNRAAAPLAAREPVLDLMLHVPPMHANVPPHLVTSSSEVVPGQGGLGNGPLVPDELDSRVIVPPAGSVTGKLVYLTGIDSLDSSELRSVGGPSGFVDCRFALR